MRNLNNSPKSSDVKETSAVAAVSRACGQNEPTRNRNESPQATRVSNPALHQRTDSSSSRASTSSSANPTPSNNLILLTPYPVEPGHTLITIARTSASEWRPEMRASAAYVAEGDNAGIIINKPASIMDYNKTQAGQKERQLPPSAKMSFKVFLMNSETNKVTLEHRTLRFWLDNSPVVPTFLDGANNGQNLPATNEESFRSTHSFASLKQESSQLAQAYFCQLIGSKPDDFPKNYVGFIMKLMRLLKGSQFFKIIRMEVELRQLAHEEQVKPPSPVSSIDGSQSGRGSPLTSQRVLDIIESSYPNPISVRDICSSTQSNETLVRQLVNELAAQEKINSTDDGQNYTRTIKPIDTKVNMVRQMPKVQRSQQPVIAIITSQYCEKLAVDSMISDKETFVRYRVSTGQDSVSAQGAENSSNYVYTLGNIADYRVVSTKLISVGHSRGALIAAGNATTRLLGTFPEIEHVFLVGCGGGVPNYTDFASHVRLGDIVVSHLAGEESSFSLDDTNLSHHHNNNNNNSNQRSGQPNSSDFVYVHCRAKQQQHQDEQSRRQASHSSGSIPVSYSIHKNLRRVGGDSDKFLNRQQEQRQGSPTSTNLDDHSVNSTPTNKPATIEAESESKAANNKLTYEQCHFRLWRPATLELQQLAQRLWLQGLDNPKHRIWNHYIDEGIELLRQQDIEAARPPPDSDKLYMSIGAQGTIEVNHPEACVDEADLRRDGRPMCHFGPIGSGRPALANDELRQQMISAFDLRAFDSEFDSVVESIHGSCKESFVMIRGISDYRDGRKKKEWQQYSALVAAAFMKSIIVNLKPTTG